MKLNAILLLMFCLPASANDLFKTVTLEKQNIPSPTVIVAHGCDGTDNASYKNWIAEVSSWGYNAIMVDSFKSRGYHNICSRPSTITPGQRSQDINVLANYIKAQSWHTGKIGVIGFSHGGSTVMNLANNDSVNGIDAAVAYYPSCYDKVFFGKRHDFIGIPYADPKIPVQIHFAEKDTWTPPKQCVDIKNYEAHTYKNSTHAFDMNLPTRTAYGHYMEYNHSADILSRQRTKEFLDRNLK